MTYKDTRTGDRHKKPQFNLRIDRELKDKFDDKCKDEGVTFNGAIEHLMRKAINENLPLKPNDYKYY